MARGIRRTDTDSGWVNRKFREIDAAIRELRSAKRVITNITIPGGDDGDIVEIGDQPQGDRGLTFRREDGTEALTLRKPLTPSDPQRWAWRDRNGASVVEEEALGAGLGKPYLELPFQPVAATSGSALTCGPYGFERTTTSGAFETLFAYDGKAQNLLIDFKFAALCSDGTTAGEIQVINLDTGNPRPGYVAAPWLGVIPAGTTSMTVVDPTPAQVLSTVGGAGPGGYMRLGVQVRRTAGAGSITLAVAQAMGG